MGVSTLSPWVRRRLVTERELAEAALARHGAGKAEKFVQEVVWRTYFKGWLELRPAVWADYQGGLADDLDASPQTARSHAASPTEEGRDRARLFRRLGGASSSRPAICTTMRGCGSPRSGSSRWACPGGWARISSCATCSTAIRLPTRWAGAGSRGCTPAARPMRRGPRTSRNTPAGGSAPRATISRRPWRWRRRRARRPMRRRARPDPPAADIPSVLLIHEDDCRVEDLLRDPAGVAAVGLMAATPGRSPRPVAAEVAGFDRGALADAGDRLAALGAPAAEWLEAGDPATLADWATGHGAGQIVAAHAPTGPVRDRLDRAAPALARAGIGLPGCAGTGMRCSGRMPPPVSSRSSRRSRGSSPNSASGADAVPGARGRITRPRHPLASYQGSLT